MPVTFNNVTINRVGLHGGRDKLLDKFPGAAAAYSLRVLNTDYKAPVVQVRRSGDNAEETFTANEVGDGTLAAWVTAGGGTEDGFVKTWYDQSGNGNDASQTTLLNQPQIVASGAVVLENGEAAIDFDGVDDLMSATVSGMRNFTDLSAFSCISPDAASAADTTSFCIFGYAAGGSNNTQRGLQVGASTGSISLETIAIYFSSNSTNGGRLGSTAYSHSAGEQFVNTSFFLNTGTKLYKNSSQITLNLGAGMSTSTNTSPVACAVASDALHICSVNGVSIGPSIYIQDLIIYPTDQSSNRTGIESNIASHYGITLS